MTDEKKRGLMSRFVRWIGYDLGITPNQITLGRLVLYFPGWFMWFFMAATMASIPPALAIESWF